ncbi:MAG: hypothetical protein JW956_15125 [Calditrichaceae bacterium]|nr:hypothetical protein [Calditrichaceae bacterium]
MKKLFICCLFMVVSQYGLLTAQVKFSGMTQSSIYTWENFDEAQLIDYYQHINARVSLESYRDLYVKTYFRFGRTGDPAEWNERVYNAYLNFLSPCRKWDARLGRQFVYSGVMNGTVDGIMLNMRPIKHLLVKLLAGMEAPVDRALELTPWSDGNVLGAFAGYKVVEAFNFAASYVQKTRSDDIYWQLAGASFSGNVFNNLYYQAQYEHNLKTSQYQAMRYRLNYFLAKWNIFAEYNSQRPRIYEDSFFQIFEQTAFNQIRSGVGYQAGNYNVGLHDVYTMYEKDESTNQIHATISSSYGMIGLLYQSGYGGDNTGIYGSVRYDVLKNLTVYVRSSYYQYERQTTAISEDATAVSGGVTYKLSASLQVKAEIQERINTYYDNDVRGLFRIRYAFNN